MLMMVLCGCGPSATVVIVVSATPAQVVASVGGTATDSPATAAAATATTVAYPWLDEAGVMAGVCFEAAQARSGEVFVLRDAAAHIAFYDGIDGSTLCRRPIQRVPFDFGGSRMLAGLWSAGVGCTARHDVLSVTDTPETLAIRLRFVVEGTCGYELVRPFWISFEGEERAVSITLE